MDIRSFAALTKLRPTFSIGGRGISLRIFRSAGMPWVPEGASARGPGACRSCIFGGGSSCSPGRPPLLRGPGVFVAPACPDLSRASREPRRASSRHLRARFVGRGFGRDVKPFAVRRALAPEVSPRGPEPRHRSGSSRRRDLRTGSAARRSRSRYRRKPAVGRLGQAPNASGAPGLDDGVHSS